jgi:hypothetical protein
MGRFRRNNFSSIDSPRIQNLLERLGSKDAGVQAQALEEVPTLSGEDIDSLLNGMAAESARHRRRYKLYWRILIAYFGVLALVMIFYFGYRLLAGEKPFDFPQGLVQMLTYTGVFSGAVAAGETQKRGARILSKIDDMRAVGFLIDALTHQDQTVEADAREALIRMLPRMKSSDSSLLTKDHRDTLHKALKTSKVDALRRAVLSALEQVGDESAIPVVKAIAENRKDALQDAAQACLPGLIASSERIRAGNVLLRAASAPEEASSLLRPASGGLQEDTASLLRPADEEFVTQNGMGGAT